MNSPLFSIVSPVYKAREIIPELISQIEKSVQEITENFEIILVDDGCPENSWEIIEEIAKLNKRVVGIKLSRNFGQHHAITAGLDFANGDWVVVMDCDLQDNPAEIINLYNKALKGYDIVFAARSERKDNYFKKLTGLVYSKVYNFLSGLEIDRRIGNFGIYSNKAINAYKKLREPFRLFGPLINWVGFRKTTLEIAHQSRFQGKSSYSFNKLLSLAFEAIIVNTDKPLRILVKLGFFIFFISLMIIMYYLQQYFQGKIEQPGFMTTILSLWLICGLLMFSIGILGLYLTKIFTTIRYRPIYIVETNVNYNYEL
jgi:glycosyltransferase involved in cell wall biosynthesis